jgi:hypothetical protein
MVCEMHWSPLTEMHWLTPKVRLQGPVGRVRQGVDGEPSQVSITLALTYP